MFGTGLSLLILKIILKVPSGRHPNIFQMHLDSGSQFSICHANIYKTTRACQMVNNTYRSTINGIHIHSSYIVFYVKSQKNALPYIGILNNRHKVVNPTWVQAHQRCIQIFQVHNGYALESSSMFLISQLLSMVQMIGGHEIRISG